MSDPGREQAEIWQRKLLDKIATGALTEQRRARRWGVFFKLILIGYLFALLGLALRADIGIDELSPDDFTAVVDIEGVISSDSDAAADRVVESLREAFAADGAKGVLIRINSPGGSPVQAGRIREEILRLRKKHPELPVHAVVGDICASGGYYIAVAAEQIHVDRASIVGSIGVRIDSFGLVDAIDTLGIERRLYTAGRNKGILDPFLPVSEEADQHLKGMLETIHNQFIAVVKEGRGERLKGEESLLFSGLFWSGEEAITLGLADHIGNDDQVARDVIGAEELVVFTHQREWIDRFADRVGATIVNRISTLTGIGAPVIH